MKTPFRSAVSVTASGNYIGNQRIASYQFGALLGPSRLVLRLRLVGLRRALALLKGIRLGLGVGSARVE